VAAPNPSGFELVQFSSGTTARPKGVLLTDKHIGANVNAILAALRIELGDAAVSWLPLSHDMGLIGMLFTSIAAMAPNLAGPSSLTILDPAAFLRAPGTWIDALTHRSASITAAPSFAYEYCAERARDSNPNLSRLRCAIVGGDVVRAQSLRAFSRRYESSQLPTTALCPAYGMAEMGLAVTLGPVEGSWDEYHVDMAALHRGDWAFASSEANRMTLVSSGIPIPGYSVRSDRGEGFIGRLYAAGPSAGVDAESGLDFVDDTGWLETGDSGVVLDGQVVVLGRTDERINVRGRMI
jgi:fatty-acyl-CoA synthase